MHYALYYVYYYTIMHFIILILTLRHMYTNTHILTHIHILTNIIFGYYIIGYHIYLQGQSALHVACRLGPPRAVQILLSFKADLRLTNNKGQTAVDIG
jgi:hypothetical protein